MPRRPFLPIRGNLDTRLRKLDAGEYDALVLAAAGLRRSDRGARISALLPVDACVPAPGQGIIAVEIRRGDAANARRASQPIDDAERVGARCDAERAVVTRSAAAARCRSAPSRRSSTRRRDRRCTRSWSPPDGARSVRGRWSGVGPTRTRQLGPTRRPTTLLADGAASILAEAERGPLIGDGESSTT